MAKSAEYAAQGYPVVAVSGESEGEQFEGSVVYITRLIFLPHDDDLFAMAGPGRS